MDFLSGGATVGMPRPTPAAPWIKADARGLVGHFGREKVQWHLASEGCAGLSSPGSSLGLEALLEKWGNGPKKCFAGAPVAESWSWDLQYWEELEEIAAGAGISQHHAPGRQIPLPFTPASPRSKPSIASQDLALAFLFYFFPFLYNSLEGNS